MLNNLLDYLEHSAECFPNKTAFSDETESATFSQLVELGEKVGAAISGQISGINLPVAVLTRHTVADVVAFIGTLYAGCFYVPLDGYAPTEHTELRIEAIKPAMVINAKTLSELPYATPTDSLFHSTNSTDPAYAIFTSGSTGVPKAAMVSHCGVINLTEWLSDTFNFNEKTIFAGQCPFYFDSSVQELYSTLKSGATTHLFPKKYFISPLKVLKRVEEVGANVMPWAAAAVKLIANSGAFEKYVPQGVTDVIFGGENMPAKILNIWRKALPDTRFTNVYGPTETTVDCSYYTINRDLSDDESVPIGYPCRNTQLLLLDEDGKSASKGEIYVRGAGVGLGYYNNPERTAEVFVQNPLDPAHDIVYRTGDIARLNEYGELVFLTRADNQVKHMGSRVELGEVETAAAGQDGVRLVCCAYDKEKSKILMFYEGSTAEKELSAELSARLPRYMCPNVVVRVENMPVLPNGKMDRVRVRKEYYDEL